MEKRFKNTLFKQRVTSFFGSFQFVPPSLVGAYYLQPPDARDIFLHGDSLYIHTCSVIGEGVHNVLGGGGGVEHKKKRAYFSCELQLTQLELMEKKRNIHFLNTVLEIINDTKLSIQNMLHQNSF